MGPVKKAPAESGLKKKQINEVVLVGESTRIPKIQQLLKDFFYGKEPNKGVNPDEAVAYGAAIQGGILSGEGGEETKNVILLDVAPLSLGIETVGGVMTKLINRNHVIPDFYYLPRPANHSLCQGRSNDFMSMKVKEVLTKDCRELGRFDLSGIPPAPRGVPQIQVTFEIDANGILHVTAEDKAAKKSESITITSDKGRLSKEEIERMVREAEEFAEEDKMVRERIDSRNKLETWLDDNQNAEKDEFDEKLKEVEDVGNPVIKQVYEKSGAISADYHEEDEPYDDWDVACGEFYGHSPPEEWDICGSSRITDPPDKLEERGRIMKEPLEQGPTIIYVPTRKETLRDREISLWIWCEGCCIQCRFVVATIAFGMGIDKLNVRRIIHYGWPQSVEAYYQEAGRAGRDGKLAECKFILTCRYGMNTSCCRAKMLVEYFGEDFGHDKCLMCDVCVNGPPVMQNLKEEANILMQVIASYSVWKNSVDGLYDDVMCSDIRRQKFMEKPNLRMFVSKIREQSQKFLAADLLWWRGLARILENKGYIREGDEKIHVQIKFPEPTELGLEFLQSDNEQTFYVYPESDMLLSASECKSYSSFSEWGKGWADPEIRRQRLEIACGEFYGHSPPEEWDTCGSSRITDPPDKLEERGRIMKEPLEQGPTIIYVPTRKETLRIAKYLCGYGAKAAAYNAALPKSHLRRVHNEFRENKLEVYEGERSQTKDCHELGRFDLSGIPPAPRGVPQIQEQIGDLHYNMKSTMGDKLGDKIHSDDKKKIESTLKEADEWLDDNQNAEKDEFDEKLKKVEDVCNPVIKQVYEKSGASSANYHEEKMNLMMSCEKLQEI
ncbi:hypothetical protein Patl1_22542 [Pistacia atlantica]|uniref:Uncharacterized protein n=1 Tax=Pistacia atlantica TaxID=434234 RepID=A0ACC1A143_9ROSI|nr:hypothetical protein Patl1_22542 [Pistacia atlantica]